jgi:XTP/dITP diphosphohydrolase
VPAPADFSRVVFASGNSGKLREVRELLADAGVEIVAQSELGIRGADETGETFIANALLKARHAASVSGLPAIADDSGLCVDALQGRPGVCSARFAGPDASDAENIAALLRALCGVGAEQRQARFHCAAVMVQPEEGMEPLIAEGEWAGRILTEPAGNGGFGYDPVFFDEASGKVAAEMSMAEKNVVSHRGKALRLLVSQMRRLIDA